VSRRPRYQNRTTHLESAQKTTFTGANQEIFWHHWGAGSAQHNYSYVQPSCIASSVVVTARAAQIERSRSVLRSSACSPLTRNHCDPAKEKILYAVAVDCSRSGVLDRPVKPDDDSVV
jgi:hypothetical protein